MHYIGLKYRLYINVDKQAYAEWNKLGKTTIVVQYFPCTFLRLIQRYHKFFLKYY